MHRLLAIVAVALAATTAHAAWSTISLDTSYPNWHQWGYTDHVRGYDNYIVPGDYIGDVIYFTHRNGSGEVIYSASTNTGFRDQLIANPHVVIDDSGNWLIQGYGEDTFTDTNGHVGGTPWAAGSRADAIFTFKRHTDGSYEVPTSASLQFKCTTGCNDLGYLGAGSAIAKTTTTSANGYKYWSLVPVQYNNVTQGWVTWAGSADGVTWHFKCAPGAASCQTGGFTDDARDSYPLIHATDNSNPDAGHHFSHTAMVFNPSDGNFYINIGYDRECGQKGTWWRMHYNAGDAFGLVASTMQGGSGRYRIDRLQRDTALAQANTSGDYWLETYGEIPSVYTTAGNATYWPCEAQSPRVAQPSGVPSLNLTAADPMDVKILYDATGGVDSLFFVFKAESNWGHPTTVTYLKGTIPSGTVNGKDSADFNWTTPMSDTDAVIDLSALLPSSGLRYENACGGGGGFYLGTVQSGTVNGKPNLFGYLATWRGDLYSPGDCSQNNAWQGLLPIHLTLN
jgi:hypothetical protein